MFAHGKQAHLHQTSKYKTAYTLTHASNHTFKRLQPKTQPKTKQKLNEYRANFAKCTVYEISPHKQARTIRLHITRDYWRQLWRKKEPKHKYR